MKFADLSSGGARLHHAYKTLRASWENTQQAWHDPVSRHIEEEYLAELEPLVTATLDRLSALAEVLTTAEQECS